MKKIKNLWLWITLAIVAVLVVFLVLFFQPKKPGEPSLEILSYAENDALTIIDDGKTLTFCPLFPTETKAIIFYPGARIDYRAYTPIMYQIAQSGIPVVVVKMPVNLAVLSPNKADEIIDAAYFPCQNEISEWYVSGHSLGGAMAAQYASENLDKVTGLILWGSYPPQKIDITRSTIRMISIYGSNDLLSDLEEIDNSRSQFPITAKFYGISGANHAQFGDYGEQQGDGEALISPSEQWTIIADLTISFLFSIPQN